ncbi:hypothetical protein [Fodinicola acaciae]|uniref:hypothetical protein n=1 Tax=Fodinicola acaciae TaxID=2681555 RepID=UPI0013D8967A|nr:hypothetical protein [Fodinicola acaciae]
MTLPLRKPVERVASWLIALTLLPLAFESVHMVLDHYWLTTWVLFVVAAAIAVLTAGLSYLAFQRMQRGRPGGLALVATSALVFAPSLALTYLQPGRSMSAAMVAVGVVWIGGSSLVYSLGTRAAEVTQWQRRLDAELATLGKERDRLTSIKPASHHEAVQLTDIFVEEAVLWRQAADTYRVYGHRAVASLCDDRADTLTADDPWDHLHMPRDVFLERYAPNEPTAEPTA